MFLFYNLLQLLLAPFLLPILFLLAFSREKYRRVLFRLGKGLTSQRISANRTKGKTFWIHALSVGETTSALPLVTGIRQMFPDATIIFSVSTRSGRQIAERFRAGLVNHLIDGPFDLLPVVYYFIKKLRPDCFLLIETDFWPNLLYVLNLKKIPIILVNGRISDEALRGYRKMTLFFRPMFNKIDALCLQTQNDWQKMRSLGINQTKLHTLGNLKTALQPEVNSQLFNLLRAGFSTDSLLLVAGSTHPKEEEILVQAFLSLKLQFPALAMIIAPRDISRAKSIKDYCAQKELATLLRTELPPAGHLPTEIILLNTIGELASCYQLAAIAFIGGSLVKERGHNPVEPALCSCPVIFGPHMEDFSEIAEDLLTAKGAFRVENTATLISTLRPLLQTKTKREQAGAAARECVTRQRDIVNRYLNLISNYLK